MRDARSTFGVRPQDLDSDRDAGPHERSRVGGLWPVRRRLGQDHLKGIESALAQTREGDWSGRLAAWADACVNGHLDLILLHDLAFYGTRPATRQGLVDNIVIDHLAQLLQAGVDADAWSVDDSRFAAVFLFGGLHAVVDDAYAKEKRLNRSRLSQRARNLCFSAVGLPVHTDASQK
jgi:hypothetical protein